MDINFVIFISTTVINLILLIFVAIKRRNDLRNPTILTFLLGGFFLLTWFLTNYLADASVETSRALFWTRLTVPSSLFTLWFILLFSYAFPVKLSDYMRTSAVYFVLILLFSTEATGKHVFESVEIKPGSGVSDMTLGILYPAMMVFYLALIGSIIYNLYVKHKRLQGIHKVQIRYVIAGWAIFLIGASAVSLVLPYMMSNADWTKFGPLFSIFMVAFVAYAIVRHQFLDIRIVIQRGIVYASLLGIVIGFYVTTVFLLGLLLERTTNITILLSAGLTVFLGIFGVPPLERYFRRATDRIFFKDRYDYSQALQELSEILNKTIEVGQIVEKTSRKLKQILKAEKVEFILQADGAPKPNTNDAANTIPILLEDKVIGALEMGEKLSGDLYTTEDRNLLRTFSYQAAVALEKAKLYEKLKDYSRELEERVKQRTVQIQQLQEEQKQTMIDISHGLQTPLTVLKGELDLIQKRMADGAGFGALGKSIDEISKFIYDLLNLAQLETAQGDFTKEQVQFSELLNELVEYFTVLAREERITIKSDIEPGIVMLGERDRLSELVINLMSNAVKYISNERKISIRLGKRDTSVELVVEDTGIGIRKEDLPHIFDRFYRVKDPRHSEIKGTGLGLAISKKIAERHSGTIEVESEFGKGTKFTITFPV